MNRSRKFNIILLFWILCFDIQSATFESKSTQNKTMKHLLLLLLLISIISCTEKEPALTFINGSIEGLDPDDSLQIIPIDEFFVNRNLLPKSYPTSEVDSMGNFSFEIENFETGFYQLVQNNFDELEYDLYVEKGDSLTIIKPKKDVVNTIKITGKGADKLNYLTIDNSFFSYERLIYPKLRSDEFNSELEFKNYFDSIYAVRINLIEGNASTPFHIKRHFKTSLIAEKSRYLLRHLEKRNLILHGSFDYFYPDSAYYSFKSELAQIDSNEINTKLSALANILLNHKARLALRDSGNDNFHSLKANWKFDYLTEMPDCIWKDVSILASTGDYSLDMLNEDFLVNLERANEQLKNSFSTDVYRTMYDAEIEGYLKLAPGQKAPIFEFPDSMDINRKLSDYKGKIVYVDFWGTWCGACINEIPEALRLQEKYKNDSIAFVYVAMEYKSSSVDHWKNFIAGKDEDFGDKLNYKRFPGEHLIAEDFRNNPELTPYQLSMAPTYALIDHHGKIVNARAKRPKDIDEQLDELLQQMKDEK